MTFLNVVAFPASYEEISVEDVFELAGKVAIVWGGGQGIGDTLPVDGGWMAEYLIRRMW